MTGPFRRSLLDLRDDVVPAPLDGSVRRSHLDGGAWLTLRPGWGAVLDALHLSPELPGWPPLS